MKKFVFFATACVVFIFFSCNDFKDLEFPESISLKTSEAKYEIPIGGTSFSVSDKINVDSLKEQLEGDDEDEESTIAVYEYRPDDSDSDTLQYILDYQIADIPLSVNSDSDIGNITFSTTFTAPDFSSNISNSLGVDDQSLTVTETNTELSIEGQKIDFNISKPKFTKMTLKSGKIEINLSIPEDSDTQPSENFDLRLSVALADSSKNPILDGNGLPIVATSEENMAGGGKLTLNLSGASLTKEMLFIVSGTAKNGEEPTLDGSGNLVYKKLEYEVKMQPVDIELSKIEGLTMKNADLGESGTLSVDKTFDFSGMNSALKSAKVKEGSGSYLSFKCSYPEGWSGVYCTLDSDGNKVTNSNDEGTEFHLAGGITIPNSEFKDVADETAILYKKASLDGKTVTPDSVSTTGSRLVFALENATITFPDEELSISLDGECQINELDNISIDISLLNDLTGDHTEIDTGLSFSSLLGGLVSGDDEEGEEDELSNLIQDIQFPDEIKGYLFMTYPVKDDQDSLSNIKFTANLTANYDGGSGSQKILDNAGVELKQSEQKLSQFADENYVIGSKGKEFIEKYNSAELENLSAMLNDRPDNLKIAYSLAIAETAGTVELSGEALTAISGGDASVNLNIAIVLPLKIKLVDNYDIPASSRAEDNKITIDDVLDLAGKSLEEDEDLLKRDSYDDKSDFKKYAEAIKSMTLHYTVKNDTNLDLSVALYDDKIFTESDDENSDKAKRLTISGKEETFVLTHEEIMALFEEENFPFQPKVKVTIPTVKEINGQETPVEIQLTRNTAFGIENMYFSIETNGQTINLWSKNKDESGDSDESNE